jgi:preprotein translocase subunit SecF
MKMLHLVPYNTKIDFIAWRLPAFALSALLVVLSITSFFTRGLNYGVDFTGGIIMEVQTPGPADMAAMRTTLGGLGLGDVELQGFGTESQVLIRIQAQQGDERAQQAAVEKVKRALGSNVDYRRVEYVGPKVSDELFWNGIYAVAASLIMMLIYIWFRFEWQFGVCGIIALGHDVISTVGLFSVFQLDFNLTTVAAVLTIAGYSINDTVVVYDRVRENLRKYKSLPLPQLFNLSINETLSRTVMTSATTFLAVLSLYFLGGEVIHGFSLGVLFGIIFGTYSSIFVALPIMLYMELPLRPVVEGAREGAAEEPA